MVCCRHARRACVLRTWQQLPDTNALPTSRRHRKSVNKSLLFICLYLFLDCVARFVVHDYKRPCDRPPFMSCVCKLIPNQWLHFSKSLGSRSSPSLSPILPLFSLFSFRVFLFPSPTFPSLYLPFSLFSPYTPFLFSFPFPLSSLPSP